LYANIETSDESLQDEVRRFVYVYGGVVVVRTEVAAAEVDLMVADSRATDVLQLHASSGDARDAFARNNAM